MENNIIKDIKRKQKQNREINYTAIKNIRNIFRLKKENQSIKD